MRAEDSTSPLTIRQDEQEAHLARRVAQLAHESPELADLTQDQVDALAASVLADELKAQLRRAVIAERVDWRAEREAFLFDKESAHTREAYGRALDTLQVWLDRHGMKPGDMTPRTADDFIRDLRAEAGDADSVRLTVAAVSSFFSHLERRYDEVRNPVRGTKARPRSTIPTAVIPTDAELDVLQAEADPILAAALAFVRETGARVGALPALVVRDDGSWYTTSKGKKVLGAEPLSAGTIKAFRRAHLDPARPFAPDDILRRVKRRGRAEGTPEDLVLAILKSRLARLCADLKRSGRTSAIFSFHDVRHAFAQRNAGRGLRWIAVHLGHASISVTERYLENTLGVSTADM